MIHSARQPARSSSTGDLFSSSRDRPERASSRDSSRSLEISSPCSGRAPTQFSNRLNSSDAMREALSHSPERRVLHRVSSVPPRLSDGRAGFSDIGDDQASLWSGSCARHSGRFGFGGYPSRSRAGCPPPVSESGQSTLTGVGERSCHSQSQASSRLRGPGEAIGSRAKASVGIPWRQVPSYNGAGALCETGDRLRYTPSRPLRKPGAFSPRLAQGQGVRELLKPVRENIAAIEPEPLTPAAISAALAAEGAATARENWLEIVRRRCVLKRESRFGSPSDDVATPTRTTLTSRPDEDRRGIHQAFRPSKKGSHSEVACKDSCPFSRSDSQPDQRLTQPATPQKRAKPQSARADSMNSSAVASPQMECRGLVSAETVTSARRDWQFKQGKEQAALTPSGMSTMSSPRSVLSKSMSNKSFSSAHPTSTSSSGRQAQLPRWR
eukprot:TRINITY_DN24145_c0_g1_i1.p1 TRINITY_DN24145_c0_g1~~TRINITY_DN24145_c0_g1_i1.p1  ORF type:complete len:478 (+),score=48.38 TRINITY_DN24145_c0_g1_i1:118-1434(+)